MTSPAVEARSLSSLTTLAFNPPSYPRNPTHVKHEPLVLYIARVPGSRDVFLTPMKPRDKVVTAEDVQSSLYYLHFDQPEDARLVEPELIDGEPKGPDAVSSEPRQPIIPRKPVAKSVPSQRQVDPSQLLPELPPRNQYAPTRHPPPAGLTARGGIGNSQNLAAGNYLQPSSVPSQPHDKRFSVDSFQRGREEQTPPLPPRPSLDTYQPRFRSEGATRQNPYYNSEPSSGENSPLSPSFFGNSSVSSNSLAGSITTVTLIRRDPASGAQWNVARIEDPPVPEISSNALKEPTAAQKKRTGAPMYIEILNPGYTKFIGAPERPTSLLSRNSGLSTLSSTSNINPLPPEGRPPGADRVFRRRLWMEGTKYTDNNFGHRRMNSHDSGTGGGPMPGRPDSWAREQVSNRTSVGPNFLTQDDRSNSTVQMSNRTSSFRGYVFESPWNGRCEFSTGTGGSSLKCKHILPGHQGAVPAPPATVSELRFNLPSASRGDQPKRSSLFHRPRHNRNLSSTSDIRGQSAEDVRASLDRLDLSLGQEFAGGGFGGKQAKLGKLIIEDEGLKMVDMIVAANMALWWRVYDKVDARARGRSSSFQG